MVRELRNLEKVRGCAAHYLSRPVLVEKAEALVLYVRENVAPHCRLDVHPEQMPEIAYEPLRRRPQKIERESCRDDDCERFCRLLGRRRIARQNPVERVPRKNRERYVDCGNDDRKSDVGGKKPCVSPEIRQEHENIVFLEIHCNLLVLRI